MLCLFLFFILRQYPTEQLFRFLIYLPPLFGRSYKIKMNLKGLFFAALLSCTVSATRYCQCENPQHDRIFPGINEVCAELDDNWCSTNCNIFRRNCDYCQWKPRGAGTDEGYQRLKQWCYQQSGVDGDGNSYYGTDVFCYSYKNMNKDWSLTGCSYENNGDW